MRTLLTKRLVAEIASEGLRLLMHKATQQPGKVSKVRSEKRKGSAAGLGYSRSMLSQVLCVSEGRVAVRA